MRRVVVTGIGVLAPNGTGADAFESAIFNGVSGIGYVEQSRAGIKQHIAGEVLGFDPKDHIDPNTYRRTDRFVHLGIAAAKEALRDSGLKDIENAGIVIGSGQGGQAFHEAAILEYLESEGKSRSQATSVPRITSNAVTAHMAMQFNIRGINQVISTACSSGTQSIGTAMRYIQQGVADVVLAGGVEAPVFPVTLKLYDAMRVLAKPFGDDPKRASRPFDKNRSGFVLSEGAGILILESLEHAKKRSAKIYAEIMGFGTNCGAYDIVAPQPEGNDVAEAICKALSDARIGPDKVDYINAHGTGTIQNDIAETRAIKNVFGEAAYKKPISSTKSMIGHSIGASGALEAIACCLSIKRQEIHPTINLDEPDNDCDLDYVPNVSRKARVEITISNSFGFGSNNAVVVIGEYKHGK